MKYFLALITYSSLACTIPLKNKYPNYEVLIKPTQLPPFICMRINEDINFALSAFASNQSNQQQDQFLYSSEKFRYSLQVQQFKSEKTQSGQVLINKIKY